MPKNSFKFKSNGQDVSVQQPLPVDGDSVYEKDVWIDKSDATDWTDTDSAGIDTILIPFTNLHTRITNSTSDNPKTLLVHFNRSVIINVLGLGCTGGGDFSNIKIEVLNSGGVATTVFDDTGSNTKYTSRTIQFPATIGANAMKFTFATADEVCLSNIFIPKTIGVVARLQATKPDNTVTDINATAGGNLKVSVEEFDEAVTYTMADFTDNLDGEEGLQTASAMYGRVDADTLAPVKLDASTQDIQVVEHEHAEIHGGDHYNYCDYSLNEASGATIEFVMTTPNTAKWTHLTFEVSSSEGATIELYEGASGITGGTTITPRNNNRNSTNTSNVTLVKDPTAITTDGMRAAGFLAGGGRTAGFATRDRENVLKQNTTYLVRITSLAVSNDISWCAEWYEHTDRN